MTTFYHVRHAEKRSGCETAPLLSLYTPVELLVIQRSFVRRLAKVVRRGHSKALSIHREIGQHSKTTSSAQHISRALGMQLVLIAYAGANGELLPTRRVCQKAEARQDVPSDAGGDLPSHVPKRVRENRRTCCSRPHSSLLFRSCFSFSMSSRSSGRPDSVFNSIKSSRLQKTAGVPGATSWRTARR